MVVTTPHFCDWQPDGYRLAKCCQTGKRTCHWGHGGAECRRHIPGLRGVHTWAPRAAATCASAVFVSLEAAGALPAGKCLVTSPLKRRPLVAEPTEAPARHRRSDRQGHATRACRSKTPPPHEHLVTKRCRNSPVVADTGDRPEVWLLLVKSCPYPNTPSKASTTNAAKFWPPGAGLPPLSGSTVSLAPPAIVARAGGQINNNFSFYIHLPMYNTNKKLYVY